MTSPRVVRRALPIAMLVILAGLPPTAAAGPQAQRFSLGQGISVTAPAPGFGVAASAVMASGVDLDLVLETGLDGVTRIVLEPSVTSAASTISGASITASTDPCVDRAYHLLPFKWKRTWEWWFASPTTPGEITQRAATAALRSAVASITGERNDCGRPDTVNATSRYLGRTTKRRPGVRSDATCGPFDDRSVVGFGTLPQQVLGLTCTRYQLVLGLDTAIESDVLFNKHWYRWATSVATCGGGTTLVLRSIATHEFGHVFGLNHVREDLHPNLTMSTAIGACDDSAFTLGKGDMLGLEHRY